MYLTVIKAINTNKKSDLNNKKGDKQAIVIICTHYNLLILYV